jgi:aerobic-type carbon monoxide dehydrogenase small subunit (CoxS/CutS family)
MKLKINGKNHEIAALPEMPLLWALRDLLGRGSAPDLVR